MPLLNGIELPLFPIRHGNEVISGTWMSSLPKFPFMSDPTNSRYANYYNNNTNWQDKIYRSGFVTENLFRVEGGDAIAKYDLSLGYSKEDGILKSTQQNRYHTQLNGNFLVSKILKSMLPSDWHISTVIIKNKG